MYTETDNPKLNKLEGNTLRCVLLCQNIEEKMWLVTIKIIQGLF